MARTECRMCNASLAPTSRRRGLCPSCAYRRYTREPGARRSADWRAYSHMVRQVAERERALGVAPAPHVSVAAAQAVVAVRFGQRSALSREHAPLEELALTRERIDEPFDVVTNCTLLTQGELRRRSRLAVHAVTNVAYAHELASMIARTQEPMPAVVDAATTSSTNTVL
jgi:hypothetical protein